MSIETIECWAVVRYILDATAYTVTRFKEGSHRELDYFINYTLPSVLSPALAKEVADLVVNELTEETQVIDVVSKVQKLLLEKLKCEG